MNRSTRDGCGQRAAIALLITSMSIAEAQNTDDAELMKLDDWYRTEIIVFARDDQEALTSEQWDPLPSLQYPDQYRFLIDPALANRRVQESQAFSSKIDDAGVQHLVVPALERLLEALDRPDSLLPDFTSQENPDTELASERSMEVSETPAELAETQPDTSGVAGLGEGSGVDMGVEEPNDPLAVATPPGPVAFLKLEPKQLQLANQAATLRRRGQRVLFHEAWWAPLDEQDKTLPIVLERSGDPDAIKWPALQGTVTVYKSRYLHAVVDVWLNTDADYLPQGWQIDTPPRAPESVLAATLAGDSLDPWTEPEPEIYTDPILERDKKEVDQSFRGEVVSVGKSTSSGVPYGTKIQYSIEPAAEPVNEPEEPSLLYPWHHAIVHRQSRRMRGGELHYLDHPVIGVLVWVQAVSEELIPEQDAGVVAFRKQHGLMNNGLVNDSLVNDRNAEDAKNGQSLPLSP
ncbi:MAG: CsiV family protein [Pseudomonadota bacterium]